MEQQLDRVLEGYQHPVIVCDRNTREAAMEKMAPYFERFEVAQIEGDNIHADDHFTEILNGIVSERPV